MDYICLTSRIANPLRSTFDIYFENINADKAFNLIN